MKGQGRVYRPKVRGRPTAYWHLDYSIDGQRYREATETVVKSEAVEMLRKRIGDRRTGRVIGQPDRVTLTELRTLAEAQYDIDHLRSKERLVQYWNHLEAFFGGAARVSRITPTRLDDYIRAREGEGVKPQTVKNELSALRRGFRLAVEKGVLAVAPVFRMPKSGEARSGFFEEGDFAALLSVLPKDVADLVHFLRATGWRRDEARMLTWTAIDMGAGTVRLEGGRSKSGRPRIFPFGLAPTLKTLLAERWTVRNGLYVFHRDGLPIGKGALRFAWNRATRRAKLEGMLVHDLRRTAARDFRRAGVSEGVIMRLCGWETRSMFDRYNIIDEHDLAEAVALRFGKHLANNEGVAPGADSVTSSSINF